MTTIVGLQTDEKIVLGADSQTTAGWHLFNQPSGKLFVAHGMTWGISGSVRKRQIIEYLLDISGIESSGDIEYLVKVANEIRKVFNEHSVVEKNGTDEQSDFQALVVYDGNLYQITTGFTIIQNTRGFYCMGTGGDFATGALSVLRHNIDPVKRVRRAVQAGIDNDIGSSGDIQIVEYKRDTNDDR